MTQQEFMNYLNRLTVGYRLTWEDIKYDADKAIHKINDYLGTCYPEISEVMTAPHHTYSIVAGNKKIPIFPKRYLISIVIPFVASEVLARDEEFTTIYNKYLVEVEEGLYNMFQNEFNKVPHMFRQSKDEGVFFAIDHPLHKTSMHKQNIPFIKLRVYYHVNNNDIAYTPVDLKSYNYGDEITLIKPDKIFIGQDGTTAYTFKYWSYEPIDISIHAEDTISITSDVHLYAIWNKDSTLHIADETVYIKPEYKDLLYTLTIPKYIGSDTIKYINKDFAGPHLVQIVLPSSNITLKSESFANYNGALIFPKYDYLRYSPKIVIESDAIGPNVYTYIDGANYVLYLPCSVYRVESNAVKCEYIYCEYEEKPNGWNDTWCANDSNVEWGKMNG